MTGATVAANVSAPAVGGVDGGAGLGEAWVAESLPTGLCGGQSGFRALRDQRTLLSRGRVQVQQEWLDVRPEIGDQKRRLVRGQRTATGYSSLVFWGGGFRREVQPRRQHWFLNEMLGFPFRTPAFCSVSRGRRRLGEKEYRAPSVTRGVALRVRTQGP